MFRHAVALGLVVAGMAVRVSGARGFGGLLSTFHPGRGGLEVRQATIPSVPTQCQSDCNPVNSAIASGCTVSACCSSSFEMGYFNCFQCVGQSINLTDYTQPQVILDTFINECAAAGIALTKLTFPGQNPNRQLSSVRSAPSSTQLSSASRSTPFVTVPTVTAPPAQTTITSLPPTSSTPTFVQSTITTLPTDTTASPSTTPAPISSGIRTISMKHANVGLIAATMLMGLAFYL